MNIYNEILDEWINYKRAILNRFDKQNSYVFVTTISSKGSRLKSFDNCNVENLVNYALLSQDLANENNRTSLNFNSLDYFNITEPVHSLLLADLLNEKASHGQGRLFLNEFLKELEIPDYLSSNWFVLAEKNNVDIIIERKSKSNVIIIENKSNNAIDQPNQLYRYWYFNIFVPYKGFFSQHNFPAKLPENFRIIYLIANTGRMPQPHSLTKPDWLKDDSAPKNISIEWVTFLSFKENISSVFERAIQFLHHDNQRLRQYLYQYMEKIRSLN